MPDKTQGDPLYADTPAPTGRSEPRTTTTSSPDSQQTDQQIKRDTQETAQQVKQETQETAQQVKQDAQETVGKAKEQGKSMLGEQKHAAAGQVEGFAQALRRAAEQLDSQDQSPAAGYVHQAAEGLDKLGGALREGNMDSLAAQVQDYARRQPGVFLGGAVAAGFLLARFLKSSSPSGNTGSSISRDPQPDTTPESISTPT